MRGPLLPLLLLIVLSASLVPAYVGGTSAVIDRARRTTVAAVAQLRDGGYVGVTAELHVRVTCPGSGRVYVETLPLTQIDLQASTRVAALVASRVAGVDFASCDYYASIVAESPIVGGPSASGATAVAFASALLDLPMRGDVVMSGMVMPDGSIGPVGGLRAKLEAAASRGARVFLIPYGQTKSVEHVLVAERRGSVVVQRTQQVVVDLVDYGRRLGIEVVPVANVYEALEIFSNGTFKASSAGDGLGAISQLRRSLDEVFASWISDLVSRVNTYIELGSSVKERVLGSIRGAAATYIRSLVSDIESRISSTLSSARDLEGRGLLYAAASSYFQALVYAKWRYHMLSSVLDSSYMGRALESANRSAYSVIEEARGLIRGIVDLTTLSIVANALDRAYEAVLYLGMSASSHALESATYYLALADARVHTARLWLGLVGRGRSGAYVSESAILSMSYFVKSLSYNLYSYIVALSGSASATSGMLDEVLRRYSLLVALDNPIDVFAVGLSTLSYMHLVLTSMFVSDLGSSIEVLNRTIAISLATLGSSVPMDALVYMELACAYTSDPNTQLYMLSRLSMLLATYVTLRALASADSVELLAVGPRAQATTVTTVTVTRTVCPENTPGNTATALPDAVVNAYRRLSAVATIVLLALIASLLVLVRSAPPASS